MREGRTPTPRNVDELRRIVARAHREGRRVIPRGSGFHILDSDPTRPPHASTLRSSIPEEPPGGDALEVDLCALDEIIHHTPEDLVARVQCGIGTRALDASLRTHGQRIPIHGLRGPNGTIGGLLACGAPASHRFGHPRDWIIGATLVRFDGELVHSGGNVVKNVSGYDLTRLYVGSYGELGILVEAAFKLDPRPELQRMATLRLPMEDAGPFVRELDAENLSPSTAYFAEGAVRMLFEGPAAWISAVENGLGRTIPGTKMEDPANSIETAIPSWLRETEHEVRVRLHHDETDLVSIARELDQIDRSHGLGVAAKSGLEAIEGPSQLTLLGSGVTYRGWPVSAATHEAHIADYRSALHRHDGWLMVERQPTRFDATVPRVVAPTDGWRLMRATKAQLDPSHTFQAGIPVFDWTRP